MDIIYPTSSNPPTYGHADLINRVCKKFNKIYWVSSSSLKSSLMQEYLAIEELVEQYSGLAKIQKVSISLQILRFPIANSNSEVKSP